MDPNLDDLTSVSFKDTNYLLAFGLSDANVLDYFSLSQFYDKTCNNETLRMQLRFQQQNQQQQPTTSLDLKTMVGTEYQVFQSQPPSLFTIRKVYRESPERVVPQAMYYIIQGTIYQSPDIWSLLGNRLYTSLVFIQKGFEEVGKEARWHPSRGYLYSTDVDFLEYQVKLERETKRAKQLELESNSNVKDTDSVVSKDKTGVASSTAMEQTSLSHLQTLATNEFFMRIEKRIAESVHIGSSKVDERGVVTPALQDGEDGDGDDEEEGGDEPITTTTTAEGGKVCKGKKTKRKRKDLAAEVDASKKKKDK